MGFISEFKEFAMKGNLVDMAIAFVMGGAFGKVVTAFVEKMFAPIIGLIMGGIDLNDKKFVLKDGAAEIKDATGAVVTPAVTEVAIEWGTFLTALIDFIIVAFVMFMIIKAMNKMKKPEPAPAPSGPTQEELLTQIRDLLKK
ncbi:Large-conductance mechanosensitive channel [Flavobacterium cauense R2A-7]|uniref:Large-conductance mechanosensitive channel n=1 Tax=Flavobacterium cauense R2A-7 TaxID=1341154 RepID=V6S599_9FLAO|nr:large-conductance mechanosensitive channel protein MscL [Flavobacterium cauense]ESU21811.1 Large-conductance mechanosensitive channel [Flavobacterium cauense R2A-7]KGO81043.1 large-conductance mechanosensitive channel [Flavobacterium cauense R2A-7]TWI12958.1 large conductance mechanosensitive channel [Flavobacterium cauense R2A-7]